MRVSELLDIDLLQEAGIRVLAGEEHLGRNVRWVHTGEIADIAQYLSGDEALLTAGTGLGTSPAESHRYIRELAEAGVACVLIEAGRNFREVPQPMIDEAEKHEMVLVEVENDVRFVGVTMKAHTELVSSAHAALQRAIAIDEALSSLILEGAPLPELLNLLAEKLNNPVLLEDGARRVVGYGRSAGNLSPLLRNWQHHSRQGHQARRPGAVQEGEGPQRCMWTSISVRGESWGRLHVLEVDSELDDAARLALGRASASIALYLMAERDAALSDAAENSLIGGLVVPDQFSGQDFIARAAGLGAELEGNLVMLVLSNEDEGDEEPDGDGDDTATTLRSALRACGWPAVIGTLDGATVAVVSARDKGSGETGFEPLLDELDGRGLAGCHVGISRPCRPSQLPAAYGEASAARRLGPASQQGRLHLYDQLVLFRLLSPLAGGPTLANFAEGELGPLLDHDDQHNGELLKTLDAYLQSNGNKISTAKRLHLQRRSVYYRLARIEKLLGRSLDDPEQRVRLYVALRSREILESERLASGAA